MAVYIDSTSTSNGLFVEADSGTNVVEARLSGGDGCLTERLVCMAGTSAGHSALNAEWLGWNANYNYNASGGGFSSGKFTAPYDGIYMVYCWFMQHNDATYNNKNYRIRVNNTASAGKQVYWYGSNGGYYREAERGAMFKLVENDYISIYCANTKLYGSSNAYTRFCVIHVG